MKRILLMAALLPLICFSQKKQENKAYVRSILSGGLLIGERDSYSMYQWSGGVHFDRYFGGIGIGYDRYIFNSIPVYVDWRIDIDKKKLVFVYGNAGYSFPGKYTKEEEFAKKYDRLKGGFYMDLGLGYRVKLGSLHSFIFSAGYTRKELTHEKKYRYDWCTSCDETIYRYNYDFDRIIIKAAWEFGR
jgi:hypothetical protein